MSRPLLVFSDDWGRHPSSCQHLISRLLPRHGVTWVNTIGTRRPRFDLKTVRRGFEKLQQWSTPAKPGPALLPNLEVLNPRMWPMLSSSFDRKINRWLLRRQVGTRLAQLAEKPIGLTSVPIVADFMDLLPVQSWVYYCVDDFGEWPGLDQGPLKAMEARLLERVRKIVVVSETLQAKFALAGKASHLLTHGVDLDFWQSSRSMQLPELAAFEQPLVVFWGVIDRRLDLAFVRQLGQDLQSGTLLFAGRPDEPDPELWKCPRVRHLPSLAFERLPALARAAAVLMMPYADLPVTRAMQPLKLKEYMATGRPVVVRSLPATRAWSPCLDNAETPLLFSRAIRTRIAQGMPADQQSARGVLASESWEAKARQLEAWIFDA